MTNLSNTLSGNTFLTKIISFDPAPTAYLVFGLFDRIAFEIVLAMTTGSDPLLYTEFNKFKCLFADSLREYQLNQSC